MANSIQKITKKDRYNQLLAIAEVASNAELVEFIEHEMELLARKNAVNVNGERKKTANQLANEDIKEDILNVMAEDEKYTITRMLKEFDFLENYSSSKVNSLVTQLKNEGKVERIVEGRIAYFIKN